ncbi:hypothetical protein GCM10010399_85780 [Dactylosporangium fulvum]|uniref:Trypsin-co-occurring domain-containing protein n=1 Tax=Dactylosporangium fulvum TaxID=53359 RepID=A0ABY5VWR1_9ACTN|nr:trypco2 family protein [Dactylosporangium fulvum]UWP81687.1 hypothetical protein Dfulv_42360 [Dactylosporangium fulvum]
MEPPYIPLTQAIGELRTELLAAVEQATDEGLRFDVETIELELQIVAGATGKAEVGGGFWGVLTAKAAVEGYKNATQKVKLVLKPQTQGNGKVQVSDDLPPNLR